MSTPHRLALFHANFIYRRAPWVLLAIALLTLISFPFASELRLKANLIDLLPEDMASVRQLYELTDLVGGTSFLIAAIESSDEETAREAATRFAKSAASFSDVDRVDNRTDIAAFQDRKLLFLTMDSLHQVDRHVRDLIGYYRRANNPFFIDLLDEDPPELDVDSLELEEKVHGIGGFAGKESNSFMRVILLKPGHPVSDFVSSERLFNDS